MNSPLVSIIIPTFNRAHLIGETLDSVLAQTYTNWECIVVDDGSTDETDDVLAEYCAKDNRFQYHHRPKDRPPGGNAARNYGFELSKGEYIQWFDSDDLMLKDRLVSYIDEFENKIEVDFVVFRSVYFYSNKKEIPIDYKNIKLIPNFQNFALQDVFWFTIDIMYKKKTLFDLYWDESLLSGQEYNFICNYLSFDFKGVLRNYVKTKVRKHHDSIQGNQNLNKLKYNKNKFQVFYSTYNLTNIRASDLVKEYLLEKAMFFCFECFKLNHIPKKFYSFLYSILLNKGFIKCIIFILSLISALTINKGFFLLKTSRQ